MDYQLAAYLAYLSACDFFNLAKRLDKQEHTDIIPLVVNSAFACELFLKSLLIMQEKEIVPCKTHSLKNLVSKIDKSDIVIIKNNSKIFDWDSFMKEADMAFDIWRYRHETKNGLWISVWDLFRLSNAVKELYEKRYLNREQS